MLGNSAFGEIMDIKDKVVLITGAAAGIGANVVRIFLEEHVKHVTILDVDEKNGLVLEKELNTKYGTIRVKFIKCDITEENELLNAFRNVKREQGYIDVVINNAGIFNDKIFDKEIEVNFKALVRSSLQAWDLMRKDTGGRGGTVINIASIAALTSCSCVPIYSANKIAVVKFSTALGDEETHYPRTGVRVLTICFGVTDTNIITKEKIGSFDSVIEDSIPHVLKVFKWQTPDQAAQGLLEVFKQGKSSSVWIVTSGKPAVDVTDKYKETEKVFNDIIFN